MLMIAKGQVVDLAPKKRSIDQACIDTLVVDALRLGDEEIIRQVCMVIENILKFRLTDTVCTDIQNELVRLACSFPFSCDIEVAESLLELINRINSEIKDSIVMEKLVEAMLSDTKWLLNIMRGYDNEILNDSLVLELYKILECITRGKYHKELWEVLVDDIVPAILKRDVGRGSMVFMHGKRHLTKSAARIISNTINGASSPYEIEDLAFNTDCVRRLVGFLDLVVVDDDDVDVAGGYYNDDTCLRRMEDTCMCMEAIEKILNCDDDESEDNLYARMIGKHQYISTEIYASYLVEGWYL